MARIKIIIGSTRQDRFGVQPAEFLMRLAKEHPSHSYELIDLKDMGLPVFDEALAPVILNRQYAHEPVRKWSALIDEADGFVFVTPEYNHGVPAALKNAVDSLAPEWAYKPVAFVSYGVEGGVRAVEHFRSSLAWLNLLSIKDSLVLVNYWQFLDENGKYQPTPEHIKDGHRVLERIGFWGDYLKDARKQLAG